MPILDLDGDGIFKYDDYISMGSRLFCDQPLIKNFTNALSKNILLNPKAREYPDLITFGYYCRQASITRIQETLIDLAHRCGRGTVLHIAPANIPINFAFSFLMGFLSGNSNIIRLPTKIYPQTELLIYLIDTLLEENEFKELNQQILFVKSNHNSETLLEIISKANGLIIWGGDSTIERFKAIKKPLQCVEIYFPNRISSATLCAKSLIALDDEKLSKLCEKFYNDTYLVDQNACSSPNLIFWIGRDQECNKAKEIFWNAMKSLLNNKYSLDPVARIDKCLDVMKFNEKFKKNAIITHHSSNIWLTNNHKLVENIGRYGMFAEIKIQNTSQLFDYLRPNEQTLTYFGLDALELFEKSKSNISSLDRIVPMGNALNIGMHWDGKNIIEILAKKIEVQ